MPTPSEQELRADPQIKAALDIGFTLEDISDWDHLRDVLQARSEGEIADTDPGSKEQQDAIFEANTESVVASNAAAAYARITAQDEGETE